MFDAQKRTFNDVIDQNIKRLTEHWAQLTVFFGLLATGLGFFTLYIYTNTIGRAELFMPSIDVKSALVVWLFLTLLIIISYLIVLSATTWLFGCAVSQFSNIQDDLGKVTCFMFIPTAIGFATFLWMLYYKTPILNSWISIVILIAATFSTYFLTYRFTKFGALVKKHQTITHKKNREIAKLKKTQISKIKKHTKKEKPGRQPDYLIKIKNFLADTKIARFSKHTSELASTLFGSLEAAFSPKNKITRRRRRHIFVVFSWIAIFGTVACSALPAMLILRAYMVEETSEAVDYIAGISFASLTLTLAPVFVFYFSKGDIYRRIRNALIAVTIAFFCLTIVLKGTLKQITYAAAGRLDIRQETLSRYVINEDINLDDLNNTTWKTRYLSSKKIEIEAYPLFSFGDTLLLCPKDMLALDYKIINKYSKYCISTNNSKVTRKPIQPTQYRTKSCQKINICKASLWKGWENLTHKQKLFILPQKTTI